MKVFYNLNQILSRIKSTFSRKATPIVAATPTVTVSTGLSVVSDSRLRAAFADVEKYLAERYGTTTPALTYKDYANGATLVSNDETLGISLILLNTSEGLMNLPDNVMILGYVNSANGSEWLIGEVGSFLSFLKSICEEHKIQHLAIAFSTDKHDHPATVKEADKPASASTNPPPSFPTPRQEFPLLPGRYHIDTIHNYLQFCMILFTSFMKPHCVEFF